MSNSKNNLLSVMQYHGTTIAFEEIEGKMMVNATQMAKAFGKQPIEWLRFQQAKDLIDTVAKVGNHSLADLKVVKRGGVNPGTWFQEDIALFFAQWLSPEFYLACNMKLKELLTEQALIEAVPKKYGIEGLIHDGKAFYPYTISCQNLGGIKYPKASKRRAQQPEEFVKLYGRNFISETYLDLLKGYYDYKKASNQLSLGL